MGLFSISEQHFESSANPDESGGTSQRRHFASGGRRGAPFWHPTAARKEPASKTRAPTRRRSFHLSEGSFQRLARGGKAVFPSSDGSFERGNAVFPLSDGLSKEGTPFSRFPIGCRKQGTPRSLFPTACQKRERRFPGFRWAVGRREDGPDRCRNSCHPFRAPGMAPVWAAVPPPESEDAVVKLAG